jgi:glycogen synthase
VPVVRKTGGLADTVRDVDSHAPGEGNGYTFDGTDEGSLHGALDRWAAANTGSMSARCKVHTWPFSTKKSSPSGSVPSSDCWLAAVLLLAWLVCAV